MCMVMLHVLVLRTYCAADAGFDKKLRKGKQEQPTELPLAVILSSSSI